MAYENNIPFFPLVKNRAADRKRGALRIHREVKLGKVLIEVVKVLDEHLCNGRFSRLTGSAEENDFFKEVVLEVGADQSIHSDYCGPNSQ